MSDQHEPGDLTSCALEGGHRLTDDDGRTCPECNGALYYFDSPTVVRGLLFCPVHGLAKLTKGE